jgi:hypothetical protein
MKRYSLLLSSHDTDGYWKQGRYHKAKDCQKAFNQLKQPLNLNKGKVIDNVTNKVKHIS